MQTLLKNAEIYIDGKLKKTDIFIENNLISDIGKSQMVADSLDFTNCCIFPGFIDVHVHLREPGFSYKETIETGTMAAAHGGFTDICPMPNVAPVPDNIYNLKIQEDIIKNTAVINVHPYGAITKNEEGKELADFSALKDRVVAFSDDGRGIQNEQTMYEAMLEAKKYNKIIVAHCEDNSYINGGYIHNGEYAKRHNHKGIDSISEWMQVKRDLELVRKTGVKYHVCHISAKETVELIRQAKKEGLDVTCETAPHYLLLDDSCLEEDGRFKMNPPIRSREDRLALISGICDKTIDIIATDHAPHSAEEKACGLKNSSMGVVGLEVAFPVLYTGLVKKNIITLEMLINLIHDNPKKRFGIGSDIKIKENANLTIFDLNQKYKINSNEFLSKGRATPFDKNEVYGKCIMTIANGGVVWKDNSIEK